MALSGETLRELVEQENLAEFDIACRFHLEDEILRPELIREPCIMKLEMKHAVS